VRAAAVLAAVLSFFAGMWVLRQYQKHVPPFERDPEWTLERERSWIDQLAAIDEVTAEFMDGSKRSYSLRGRLVTEDDDGIQPPDPRLLEVADRLARSPLTVETSTGTYIALDDAVDLVAGYEPGPG
jgi:hypothetical protein